MNYCKTCIHKAPCSFWRKSLGDTCESYVCSFYKESEQKPHGEWRPKPLPRATHCLVAIKWAPDDIEVTETDTTFLLKEHSERIVAWMPLPDPPKGGDS